MVDEALRDGRMALLPTLVFALVGTGCASGGVATPSPRPLINSQGTRLVVEHERMREIDVWVTDADVTIREDPSFVVEIRSVPEPAYPWETMAFAPDDTVKIAYEAPVPDIGTSYQIYAFLHQMRRMGRLVDWFPETAELEDGWPLERFIVEKVADSWLLGRTTYDTPPYDPLDDLIYAQEAGMLDALVLYSQGDQYPEAVEAFLDQNPEGFEDFEAWHREAIGGELPRRRTGG